MTSPFGYQSVDDWDFNHTGTWINQHGSEPSLSQALNRDVDQLVEPAAEEEHVSQPQILSSTPLDFYIQHPEFSLLPASRATDYPFSDNAHETFQAPAPFADHGVPPHTAIYPQQEAPPLNSSSPSLYSTDLTSSTGQHYQYGANSSFHGNDSTVSHYAAYTSTSSLSELGIGRPAFDVTNLAGVVYDPHQGIDPAWMTLPQRQHQQHSPLDGQNVGQTQHDPMQLDSYHEDHEEQHFHSQRYRQHQTPQLPPLPNISWRPENSILSPAAYGGPHLDPVSRTSMPHLTPRSDPTPETLLSAPSVGRSAMTNGTRAFFCRVEGCSNTVGFKSRADVNHHMRNHGKKSHSCPFEHDSGPCLEAFYFEKDLRTHMKTHFLDRPWSCAEFCEAQRKAKERGWKRKDHWRRHMRTAHAGILVVWRALMKSIRDRPADLPTEHHLAY